MIIKFVFLLVIATTISLTGGSVSMHNPFYCFSQDPILPQIQMNDIYTAYEAVRGQHIDSNASTCAPSKAWIYLRHGTRLPTSSEIGQMIDLNERLQTDILANYNAGRTSLCAGDIELIRNWRFDPNITTDNDEDLTISGWFEMVNMAERLQEAFPTIFSSTYSPNHYNFMASNTPRAQDSIRAFADGLFGTNEFEQVEFEDAPFPDVILRPFDHCPLQREISANLEEQNAFRDGPEFQEMLSQVNAKLGFLGSQQLRFSEINVLMKICKFEQGWNISTPSPLCSAFSISNYQVWEYYETLGYYYQWGYGQPEYRTLFENFNCHLLQDMVRFLESTDPNDHQVRVFNAHFQSLQTMFVAFGVLEDSARLTRHNFAQQIFRLWRASQISPMGAGLVVIRYE